MIISNSHANPVSHKFKTFNENLQSKLPIYVSLSEFSTYPWIHLAIFSIWILRKFCDTKLKCFTEYSLETLTSVQLQVTRCIKKGL